MNTTVLASLIALGLFGGGLYIGHAWGQNSRAGEVLTLTTDKAALVGQRDAAQQLANDNASSLTSLRATLKSERERRDAMRRAAADELARRAERIAILERASINRKTSLAKEAAADEDCAVLRNLPVCAAVADRLWGEPATARPH